MTATEIINRRLTAQHLTKPTDSMTAVSDVLGLQAQYLSHARHALLTRCGADDSTGLIKSWTTRGTMHLFAEADLPLFLHEGRGHFLRPVDTMETDAYISRERKAYFAALILDAAAEGSCTREALRGICTAAGLTEQEAKSVFDPWGGLIRALCEAGQLCHELSEKKAYRLCPAFEPMEKAAAENELARRYFANFGPATLRDAAYFFGKTQHWVKARLAQLTVSETQHGGESFFHLGKPGADDAPDCIFLAGFDQFLLGYDKAHSLVLPQEHLREVFTLSGIVRPTLLIRGRVAGVWSKKGRKLSVTLFEAAERRLIRDAADRLWDGLFALTTE